MYYVYVLVNERGEKYVGYTSDLRRRVREHREGKSKSTRGCDWKLVYYEAYLSREDALNRERKLKQRGRSKQLLYERIRNSLNMV